MVTFVSRSKKNTIPVQLVQSDIKPAPQIKIRMITIVLLENQLKGEI